MILLAHPLGFAYKFCCKRENIYYIAKLNYCLGNEYIMNYIEIYKLNKLNKKLLIGIYN